MATETITKGQIYQRIKDLLVSAGWQNISSKPASDFDVFYSKGEAGDKELYFQIQDTNATATSTGCYIGTRLINKYTPGSAGVAGVFDRPSEAWRLTYLFNNVVAVDTPIVFSYHVNKDRIVFFPDTPLSLVNAGITGNIVYLGCPILFETETNSRGVVLAQTTYNNTINSGHNYIVVTNPPYTDLGATEALLTYKLTPSAEYNNADKRVISEIAYGNGVEGMRGKFDGFFALNGGNTRTGHGDILTDGVNTYKVVKIAYVTYVMFSDSYMYAFQIS